MIAKSVTSLAVSVMERGGVPDPLTRAGIRSLLRQRLSDPKPSYDEFLKACRRGPIAQTPEKANEQHYELPPAFFAEVLGPHRKYSCCEWESEITDLESAEQAALATVARRAEIEDGMQVLDLGCGWGSFSLWALARFPTLHVTAVSNSQPQREFIETTAASRGLGDRLQVVTADINEFQPEQTFDRVVSVEMFEHVTNHAELLRRIATWLHADGKLFVHIFCHRDSPYFFESRGPGDWMAEHFFTGGMMPSEHLFHAYQESMQVAQQWRVNGRHYEQTSNAWLNRLTTRRDAVLPILEATYGAAEANRWYHRWRIFFMACAELFGFRDGDEWFVAHYLFESVSDEAAAIA
ncbi:MAG: cyclopropane-fatty-acyl-phospholipid synthase family protein [Planctomycetota bacterium]